MRDDDAHVGGLELCVIQREQDRIGQRGAVIADGEQALRIGGVTAAQHRTQDGCAALFRRRTRLQHERPGAFSEETAVAVTIEGADGVLRDEPELVEVEHRLGLDRRIVTDCNRAFGLATP